MGNAQAWNLSLLRGSGSAFGNRGLGSLVDSVDSIILGPGYEEVFEEAIAKPNLLWNFSW